MEITNCLFFLVYLLKDPEKETDSGDMVGVWGLWGCGTEGLWWVCGDCRTLGPWVCGGCVVISDCGNGSVMDVWELWD